MVVFGLPRDQFGEGLVDGLGDRAGAAVADGNPIHGPHGRYLGGGAGEEDLVGDVEPFARDHLLSDLVAKFAGEDDDGVAGDAGEDGCPRGRGDDATVLDDEEVFAAALGHVAVHVEPDGLGEASEDRFHFHQLGVHVVSAGLGQEGHGVGGQAPPTRHTHVHPPPDCLLSQIGSPLPGCDDGVDRAMEGVEPHLAVAAEDARPDVAGAQLVDADEFLGGLGKFLGAVWDVHAVDARGLVEAHHVVGEAETRRAARRIVAPQALEDARAVVNYVGEDVDFRVVPVHELAVHPDFSGLGERWQGRLLGLSSGHERCFSWLWRLRMS